MASLTLINFDYDWEKTQPLTELFCPLFKYLSSSSFPVDTSKLCFPILVSFISLSLTQPHYEITFLYKLYYVSLTYSPYYLLSALISQWLLLQLLEYLREIRVE